MTYILIHLVCSVISILLQMNDSDCEISLALLYVLTGPFGLFFKLFTKII